ncbi:hypothetical protein KDM41_17280 [bacterium]|nr:hypothetical protein [bacterium]
MTRPQLLTRGLAALTAALLLFGCGGDSDTPADPPAPDVAGATLDVSAATSLGRVGVTGLPAAKAAADSLPYLVIVRADGAEDVTFPLDHDADGWFFPAPLHPVTPNAGGAVRIRVSDGTDQSDEQALTLGALPAAPGAFAATVASLRAYVEQRAAFGGTSIAELKAMDAAAVAPGLLSLKLAQEYLDADDPSADLTELAADGAGVLSAPDLELLDRVFGYFDLAGLVDAAVAEWPADPAVLAFPAGRDPAKCFTVGPDIETAPELSIAMTRSAVAAFGADPASDAGRILVNGGRALGALGGMPVVGGPAAVAGVGIGVVQAATQFVAGTLPSRFTSLSAIVGPNAFNEDSEEAATWSDVMVTASSTGWTADKSVAQTIVNALGAYLSVAEKAKVLDSDILRDAYALGISAGAGQLFDGTGIIEFCPRDWTVDISSPLYCTAAALQHRFDVDIPGQEARPNQAGPDVLRVGAQPTQFGGREIHVDTNMLVREIVVTATPASVVVSQPGETVNITTTITNADLTTLRWSPGNGTWDDGTGWDTNDAGTRPLKTPTSPDDYPFNVIVESLSRNGARADGVPARYATVRVAYEDSFRIFVTPNFDCINPGETLQFTAEVFGPAEGAPYDVLWEKVEGYGSIDQNGLYQSLSAGTSNALIRASIVGHEDVFDTARVEVSTCNCRADLVASGSLYWELHTSQIAYLVSDFGGWFYQFFIDIGNDSSDVVTATIGGFEDSPAPAPGETATCKASLALVVGGRTWQGVWDEENSLTGVSAVITMHTLDAMEGRFVGNVYTFTENGDVEFTATVDMPFRAGRWDGGAWPCD